MLDIAQLPPEQQLDFWLGTWDVSWGEGQHGTNQITRILDGRVIQERFDASLAMAFQGMSLSVYSPQLGLWRQTWVDNEGSYWDFRGGVVGDAFVLATDDVVDGQPIKLRMLFTSIERDALIWRWERSNDDGLTWALQWQIHYRRVD